MNDPGPLDSNSNGEEEAQLLAEFQALVDRVGREVAETSLGPVLRQLLEDWNQGTKRHEGRIRDYVGDLQGAGQAIATSVRDAGDEAASAVRQAGGEVLDRWVDTKEDIRSLEGEVTDLHNRLGELAERSTSRWQDALDALLASYRTLATESDVPRYLRELAAETSELSTARQKLLESSTTLQHRTTHLQGVLDRQEDLLPSAIDAIQSRVDVGLQRADHSISGVRADVTAALELSTEAQQTTSATLLSQVRDLARELQSTCARSTELTEALRPEFRQGAQQVEKGLQELATSIQRLEQATNRQRRAATLAAASLALASGVIVVCQLWPDAIARTLTAVGLFR